MHPGGGQQNRRSGEDRKSEVVHTDATVHVPKPSKCHHQHGRDDEEAHHHPQQITDVARAQRVDVDPVEDVRQRDQDDRRIDRCHQHAERGVGQGDPFVMRTQRNRVIIHCRWSNSSYIVRNLLVHAARVPHFAALHERHSLHSKTCLVRLNK